MDEGTPYNNDFPKHPLVCARGFRSRRHRGCPPPKGEEAISHDRYKDPLFLLLQACLPPKEFCQ